MMLQSRRCGRPVLTDDSSQYAFKHEMWTEGHLLWQWHWKCLWVNKLIFSKVTICFSAQVCPPPFPVCFVPLSLSSHACHGGGWDCQVAVVDNGRLGQRERTDADCCTSAFFGGGAGAWLQLYGLLLYSCLRTGAGTCSCMPIRRLQPVVAGALPIAFKASAPALFISSEAARSCCGCFIFLHVQTPQLCEFSMHTWQALVGCHRAQWCENRQARNAGGGGQMNRRTHVHF